MSSAQDLKKLARHVRFTPTPEADRRILAAAQAALAQRLSTKPVSHRPRWRVIMESPITKYAVAAILLIAAILFASHLTHPDRGEERIVVEPNRIEMPAPAYAQAIEQCYQDKDLPALIQWLGSDEIEAQVLAARYLGEIGDADSLAALVVLAESHADPVVRAACEKAMEQIRTRLSSPAELIAPNDVNQAAALETSTTVPTATDVNNPTEDTLQLEIVDKETGKALSGVWVESTGFNIKKRSGVSDNQGCYCVVWEKTETMDLKLIVKKQGYVPLEIRFYPMQSGQPIPKHYEVQMIRGVSVRGRVTTRSVEPVAGMIVTPNASYNDGNKIERYALGTIECKTDEQGYWYCREFPPDVHRIFLQTKHPDYIIASGHNTTLGRLQEGKHVIVVWPGLTIRGRVQDTEGRPIAEAALMQGISFSERRRIRCDESGAFTIPRVGSGETTLTVQAPGFAPDLKRLDMTADINDLVFTLEPGYTVTARVVDHVGAPIQNARIEVEAWREKEKNYQSRSLKLEAKTDTNGWAVIEDAPADMAYYSVSKGGFFTRQRVAMTAREDAYEIVLDRTGTLTGRVLDADTKKLLPSFVLKKGTTGVEDGKLYWGRRPKHYQRGAFSISFDEPYLAIQLEAEGYRPFESEVFVSEGGAIKQDFYLQPGQQEMRQLKALLADGLPAKTARVVVVDEQHNIDLFGHRFQAGGDAIQVTVDANGLFALPLLTQSHDIVIVHEQGYGRVVGEDTGSGANIGLSPWGRLQGHWEDAPQGARVQLDEQGMGPRDFWVDYVHECTVDANGMFEFSAIPAGYVQISQVVEHANGWKNVNHQVVQVKPGETNEVEFALGSRDVVGVLYDEAIQDYSAAKVELVTQIEIKSLNLPPITIPEDFLCWSENERVTRIEEMMQSEAMKNYMAATMELNARMKQYTGEVTAQGEVRFEHVLPGLYDLRVTLRQEDPALLYRIERKGIAIPEAGDATTGFRLEPLMLTSQHQAEVGEIAPDFELMDLEGYPRRMQDYRGGFVLLEVGGPFPEMNYTTSVLPHLLKVQAAAEALNNLTILSLGMWTDIYDMHTLYQTFNNRFGIEWNTLLVEMTNLGAMPDLLDRYPDRFILVDPEGKVIMTAQIEEAPQLLEKIKAAIRPYLP